MQASYSHSESKTALASLGTRFAAFALDALLILTLIGVADFLTFSSDDAALLLKPERVLHLLLGWLYFAGSETCSAQATLGKYLLQIRVATTDNQRISFKAASFRYFAKLLTPLVLIKQLVKEPYLTRRTFHDKITHSQVVLR